MRKLRKNAGSDDDCAVEMTKACEKLFKNLSRSQQIAVDERIVDIRQNPSQGSHLQGQTLKGLLHAHVRGKSSNLLVVWSYLEEPGKIVVEAVGPHKVIDWLERRRSILETF